MPRYHIISYMVTVASVFVWAAGGPYLSPLKKCVRLFFFLTVMQVGAFQIDFEISSGHQAAVHFAEHSESGKKYAAKLYPAKGSKGNGDYIGEVNALRHLSGCSGVVKMEAFFTFEDKGIIILEQMPFDLMHLIEHNMLTLEQRLNIFYKVCVAVKECHKRNVVHLDIKPENILISSNFKRAKLCDFGNAQILTPDSREVWIKGGTIHYSAPEIFQQEKCDGKKVDIWSLGILYHVLISLHWPYSGTDIRTLVKSGSLSIHTGLTKHQTKTFNKMTHINPAKRCTIKKLCYLTCTKHLQKYSHLQISKSQSSESF